MKKDIYYCIVLSDRQLDFLAGSKYGIDRMKVLKSLIDAAVIKKKKIREERLCRYATYRTNRSFGSGIGHPFRL